MCHVLVNEHRLQSSAHIARYGQAWMHGEVRWCWHLVISLRLTTAAILVMLRHLRAIHEHPFNAELEAGTLDRDRFAFYIVQDARYLVAFSKALATASARATDPDEAAFFKAQTGIEDEDKLKKHILDIQRRAYEVWPYPCIRRVCRG